MSGVVMFWLFVFLFVWSIAFVIRDHRRHKAIATLVREIERTDSPLACLYSSGLKFQAGDINSKPSRRRPFVVAVTPDRITIYPVPPNAANSPITITPDQLRWFGRPKKYSLGSNELWIHAQKDGRWLRISLHLTRAQMQALIRALKVFATEEQVTAYRRRRPYIHVGPALAHPATQDMHGAWALRTPCHLYLMPTHLVVLDGSTVRRAIPLDSVQKVSAIRRLDAPGAEGLVRFEADGEAFAFALAHHESFAEALGEAAKRTLEDPILWQRKKKKHEVFEDDDEDEDEDPAWLPDEVQQIEQQSGKR